MGKIWSTERSPIKNALDLVKSATTPVKVKYLPLRGRAIRKDLYELCTSEDMRRIIDVLEKINVQVNTGRTDLDELRQIENYSVVFTHMGNGTKVDLFDIDGSIPLLIKSYWHSKRSSRHYCAENGDIYSVRTLQTCFEIPALHMASVCNDKDLVSLLLSVGAEVGERNRLRMTALHCASQVCASAEVIRFLVDIGEDVNAKDCHGDTPLHLVASLNGLSLSIPFGCTLSAIEHLLSHGAKVLEKNNNLQTPYETLQLAISRQARLGSHLLKDQEIWEIEATFIKHVIKLEELNPQVRFDVKWKLGQGFYKDIKRRCQQELKYMTSATIVKDISLYEVLSRTIKPYLLSSDDVKQIDEFICSSDLVEKCPLYTVSLIAAVLRLRLLTLAVHSFNTERRKQMVKEVPCEVAEQLLTYLTNEDLRNFVKSE